MSLVRSRAMRSGLALLVAAAALCWIDAARADKRVALVIGNDRYLNMTAGRQLKKAVNDANTVAAAMRALWMKFTIEGVYPGRLYEDTAVTKLLVSSDPAR